jgi:hypothetical protein
MMGHLKPLADQHMLANWLGTTEMHLVACARTMPKHVNKFAKRDGKGKLRTFYEPDHNLRWIQERIEAMVLRVQQPGEHLHAFVPGRSPASCARIHEACGVCLKVDLKDFFPSITASRVYGFFTSTFKCNRKVAWALTRLTTFDGHLCQGFITSPTISNLIARRVDVRVSALARKYGFVYTRYCDDLILSSKTFRGDADFMRDAVYDIVQDEGFRVNLRKTSIRRQGRRITVTGLVVNVSANLSRHARRQLRVEVDHWEDQPPSRRRKINGHISWLNTVRPDKAQELWQKIKLIEAGELKRERLVPAHHVPIGG